MDDHLHHHFSWTAEMGRVGSGGCAEVSCPVEFQPSCPPDAFLLASRPSPPEDCCEKLGKCICHQKVQLPLRRSSWGVGREGLCSAARRKSRSAPRAGSSSGSGRPPRSAQPIFYRHHDHKGGGKGGMASFVRPYDTSQLQFSEATGGPIQSVSSGSRAVSI